MADQQYSVSAIFKVIDQATAPMRKLGTQFQSLGMQVNTLGQGFRKLATSALAAMAKVGAAMRAAGETLTRFGKNLVMKVTLPLGIMGAVAFKASLDLNRAMANVASLIPEAPIERVKELKKGVSDLAVSVGKDSVDLAGGLYQVISAFGDSAESLERLNLASRMATAGLSTTGEAVDVLIATGRGYGDSSIEMLRRIADLTQATVNLGVTTLPELASAMGGITPMASTLGVHIEEVYASFAALTGTMGSATEISTQMSGALRAMLKPTTEMKKAMKELGYTSVSAMIGQLGFVGSVQALTKHVGGAEDKVAALFGRAEAMNFAFAVSGKQADSYREKLAAMEGAAGSLDKAFAAQTEGINKVGFAWDQFKARIKAFREELGDALGPVLMKFLTPLGKLLKVFASLSDQTKTLVVALGMLAFGLPIVIVGLGMLLTGIGMLAAPITLVIVGLAGLAAAMTVLYVKSKNFRAFFQGLWQGFKNSIAPIREAWWELKSAAEAFGAIMFGQSKKGFKEWEKSGVSAAEAIGRAISAVIRSMAWAIEKMMDVYQAYAVLANTLGYPMRKAGIPGFEAMPLVSEEDRRLFRELKTFGVAGERQRFALAHPVPPTSMTPFPGNLGELVIRVKAEKGTEAKVERPAKGPVEIRVLQSSKLYAGHTLTRTY